MIIDEELVDEILTFIESVWGKLPDEDFENQAESIYDKLEKALKSAKSALAEQDDEAVAYAEQDNVDMQSYDDLNFSYPVSTKPTENRTVPLYTRPSPNTYTEHDIDEAIGAVDWANTSWQQAAVEAKKLVMRFVGSQVTMEPKRLSDDEVSSIIDNMAYGFAVPALWRKAFLKFANALMDKMTGGGK